ncbi:MAG TPA: L-2-hydroxyglutarate oxidase [Bryobacteraceae bacterium]|nr:L-2-hydroxyglutarate oxidase [Bryobacteraceae bacterium]
MREQIVVVGGGIIGLAAAYRIGQRFADAHVTVLEKEDAVGQHQSGHNSGVLHAGLYYKPGSRKALLAVRGIRQMVEFCKQKRIAHEVCGKCVVATEQEEIPRLHTLLERGTANGLTGLRRLTGEQLREIEPHAAGIAAIHVPEEGIVDYSHVCRTMESEISIRGGKVITRARVTAIRRDGSGWRVVATRGDYPCTKLVTCAGLHADRVAALTGQPRTVRIVPFRGEYYKIRPERQSLVKHLIYPVPDPAFPFLGVHFTRMIHGGVEAGPNAVLALAREGYTKSKVNPGDVADALTFPGLWKFLAKYPAMCWQETRRSFSRDLFCRSLQRLVPEIQSDDLIEGGAGVRAQAMSEDGSLVEDFHFVEGAGELHVVNAPSPGATASLAIGEEIAEKLAANERK